MASGQDGPRVARADRAAATVAGADAPRDRAAKTVARAGMAGFQFGAGSLCLDLVATIEEWRDHHVDLLTTPEALAAWLRTPGLPVPAGGLTDGDLRAARTLRSAIDRLARALISGAPAFADDVRTVNTFGQRPTPVFLLRPSGRERTVVEEVDAGGALSVIARDAIHLFSGGTPARLRECARDSCTTLFYDRSPSGRRRWCAMKGCGEMVASASYRRRRAAAVPKADVRTAADPEAAVRAAAVPARKDTP